LIGGAVFLIPGAPNPLVGQRGFRVQRARLHAILTALKMIRGFGRGEEMLPAEILLKTYVGEQQ